MVTRVWLSRLVALLATLISLSPAQARERDLGPIPSFGLEAARTLPDRDRRVISELACGDEARFMAELRNPPDRRPLGQMVAKAAALSGATSSDSICEITQIFDGDEWDSNFAHESDIDRGTHQPPLGPPVVLADASWTALKAAILTAPGEAQPDRGLRAAANAVEIQRLVNRVEGRIYGSMCGQVVRSVTPIVREPVEARPAVIEYRIAYVISADCLQQQVATVILARDFQRTTNPGTDGLPCVLLGKTEGDWDMVVTKLTRATFFLRAAFAKGVAISDASRAAMDKLQTRLLTLSGEPAVEVHSISKCGNADNQYGTARQRLDDETFYDPELAREVEGDGDGGDSFWDFLGGLLLFLALLILGLVVAVVAAILVVVLGPILAAIVLVVGAVLAVIAEVPQTIIGAVFGGIEETENHLFMQNSSKYLMNKMLIEQLYADNDDDGVEDYEEFQEDLRRWFRERLQRITENDFAEYNSKPYAGFTVPALLNLYDFSCEAGYRTITARSFPKKCSDDDRNLINGVALVLDLNAAKVALGSNQCRRIVPFRRLAHTNTNFTIGPLTDDGTREPPHRLLGFESGADHMGAALQLWTGMTFHGPGGHASTASLGEMLWEATSRYKPHELILDMAIDKSTFYQQTYHHAGWERYSSGPGWLLTAGGTSTGYAQGFDTPFGKTYPWLIKDSDRGAGVPTSLIVTSGRRMPPCDPPGCMPERRVEGAQQDLWSDFIRFEGLRESWTKDGKDEPRTFDRNFCVNGSFACGVNLQIPAALRQCLVPSGGLETPSARVFLIGDSSDEARCGLWNDEDASNDFYAVVYSQPCAATGESCGRGGLWGFIEIVPKTRFADRAALAQAVLGSNAGNFDAMGRSGGTGTSTYQSVTSGAINFDPAGSFVRSVNGEAMDHLDNIPLLRLKAPFWPRAQGVVNRTGAYRYTITHPRTGQSIALDFSIAKEPKRVLP